MGKALHGRDTGNTGPQLELGVGRIDDGFGLDLGDIALDELELGTIHLYANVVLVLRGLCHA